MSESTFAAISDKEKEVIIGAILPARNLRLLVDEIRAAEIIWVCDSHSDEATCVVGGEVIRTSTFDPITLQRNTATGALVSVLSFVYKSSDERFHILQAIKHSKG
jgi:hypothetical protein